MSLLLILKKIPPFVLLFFFFSAAAFSESLEEDFKRTEKLLRTGKNKEVLESAESIRKRAAPRNDLSAIGRAYVLSAQASYTLGKMDDMKKFIYKAIEIFEKTGDKAGIGKSYYVYSIYFQKTGNALEMKKYLLRAQEYAGQSDDNELKVRIFIGLGLSNWNLGEFTHALQEVGKAVEIAKTLEDHHLLALAYESLALNHSARGEFNKALAYYKKALSLFEEQNNFHAAAYVYGNMGVTYEKMGDVESAMAGYEKSLSLHQKNEYRFGQCIQTDNMAEILERLQQYPESIELSLKAIALSKDEGAWIRVQLLQNLADRYLSAGELDQSRFYALKAGEELQTINNPIIALRNDLLLSELALKQGKAEEALAVAQSAITTAQQMGDLYQLGILKGREAQALSELNKPAVAEQSYHSAIKLHEEIYARPFLPRWYADLAHLIAIQGRTPEALTHYEKSIKATVQIADLLLMDRFRIDLLRQSAEIHREYASFLASLGKKDEAWKIVEQGRSRDLQLRIAQATGAPGMDDEQRDLLGLIHKIQNNISSGSIEPAKLPQMYSQLTDAAAAYQKLQTLNTSLRPDWNPSTALNRQDLIVIEYAFHNNELLIFSASQGKTRFRKIEQASGIQQLVKKYIKNISEEQNSNLDMLLATKLYDQLIGPELKNNERKQIVIVPDGILHSLPFGALGNADGVFLAEQYVLSYTPSLKMLDEILQRKRSYQPGRILAVAATNFSGLNRSSMSFPPLPLAREEAQSLRRYGNNSMIFIDQSESAVKNTDLSTFELIHFATHSVIDEKQPEHSSLVLKAAGKDDGYLRAEEIYRMRIPGSTIFLSSCRSGTGKFVAGEGILGLPHAFFAAGAGSMVMSFWNIKDNEAQLFSSRFYKNLQKYPVAAALQKTQTSLLRTSEYYHPRIWSAYFVYGDGFRSLELRNPDLWKWAAVGLLAAVILFFIWILKRKSERNRAVASSISAKG